MSFRYQAGILSAFYNGLKVPNAPTIGTATGGSAQASVAFTAPANTGGSVITSYTVTSSPGGFTGTGALSPIVVTGLANGTAYTFTVRATNGAGTGPSSAASNSATPVAPPTVIGSAYGGGFYAGQIGVAGVATHYLIVAPVSSGESASKQYKNVNTAVPGADSVIDGPQNTADIVADGNSTVYPAAHFCNDASIGGFTDWYMPAKNELEICYYNLKPTTTANNTSSGTNTNAVPSRGSNYTAGTPAQTSAADFKDTGAEDFAAAYYWSSTENSATFAWLQYFSNGNQYGYRKNYSARVRCVRRVAV
jgi:hypothetical protein